MPEGDTLWRLARRLKPLEGRAIVASSVRVPQLATEDLRGLRIERVWPWGKHLFWRLIGRDEPWVLHTHLRMDGNWVVEPVGARRTHRDRIVVTVEASPHPSKQLEVIGRDLGWVRFYPESDFAQHTGHLGPDPLADDWLEPGRWRPNGRAEAIRRWAEQADRPVGLSLLDQRVVAGPGNVYRNEVLFLLGAHPWESTQAFGGERVLDLTRGVMRANLHRARRVFTGASEAGQRCYVYGREGQPCRRCGTPVSYDRLGGSTDSADRLADQDRAIWWCPNCQPRPPRRGDDNPTLTVGKGRR